MARGAGTSPRVVVIGAGRWGRHHARNLAELGALHGVCDRRAEVRRRYRGAVAVYDDWRAVLDDPLVTAVTVVTPPAHHAAIARAAVRAGRDVLVEKPLCHDLDEAVDLVAEATAAGRILMGGHLLRYHPAVERLIGSVGRSLGPLRHVATVRRSGQGRIPTERSALWDLAPHDVSTILALVGGRLPERVVAHAAGDGAVAGLDLTFAGGPWARIDLSWLHPWKEQRLVAVGAERTAVFDDRLPWPEKLAVGGAPGPDADGRASDPERHRPRPLPVVAGEPLRRECAAFVEACRTRRPPPTDGAEALRVLRVLDAAQRSLDAGSQAVEPAPAAVPVAVAAPAWA